MYRTGLAVGYLLREAPHTPAQHVLHLRYYRLWHCLRWWEWARASALGYPFWVAIIMGSITGAAGGVIRDVFINEIPLIFRKEIYAMACVVGGTAYWICELAGMHSYGCQVIGGMSVFITRILAVKYKICLPILSGNDGEEEGKES